MKKQEYIDELRHGLEEWISESELRSIAANYGAAFERGAAAGKGEEQVAEELGSPAVIARAILDQRRAEAKAQAQGQYPPQGQYQNPPQGSNQGQPVVQGQPQYQGQYPQQGQYQSGAWAPGSASNQTQPEMQGQPQYQSQYPQQGQYQSQYGPQFQGGACGYRKPVDPRCVPYLDRMASMGRRLGAYLIDQFLLTLAVVLAFLLFVFLPVIVWDSVGHVSDWDLQILLIVALFFLCMGSDLLNAIFIWASDGRTPGKWMLKIRVIKLNGAKITFMDALLREVLIKGFANGVTSGLLNMGSFIWGCATNTRCRLPGFLTNRDKAGKAQIQRENVGI